MYSTITGFLLERNVFVLQLQGVCDEHYKIFVAMHVVS